MNEAKYYQAIESIYDDFTAAVERSAAQYTVYVQQMQLQAQRYEQMKQTSRNMDASLKNLYDSI